jgi:hypothetical protein
LYKHAIGKIFKKQRMIKRRLISKVFIAFLGLCEQGLVKGIKRGIYLTNSESNLNKQYALIAVKILTNNATISRKQLWEEVKEHLNISKNHNSQMDVVIALFENKMIVL